MGLRFRDGRIGVAQKFSCGLIGEGAAPKADLMAPFASVGATAIAASGRHAIMSGSEFIIRVHHHMVAA